MQHTCIAANFTPAASKEGINVGSLMRRVKKNTDGAASVVLDDTDSAQRRLQKLTTQRS